MTHGGSRLVRIELGEEDVDLIARVLRSMEENPRGDGLPRCASNWSRWDLERMRLLVDRLEHALVCAKIKGE